MHDAAGDFLDFELHMWADGHARAVGRESHALSELTAPAGYLFRSRLQFGDDAEPVETMQCRFAATFDQVFTLRSGDYTQTSGDESRRVTIERDEGHLVVTADDERATIADDGLPIVPSYVLAQLPMLLERRPDRAFQCRLFDEGARTPSAVVELRRVADLAALTPPPDIRGAGAAWQQVTDGGTTLVTTYLAADGSLLANDYGGAWAVRR